MISAAMMILALAMGDDVTVVRAGRILPMGGDPVENGAVIVRGGKIEAVGVGLEVPEGAEIVDLGDAVLLPGLIDVRATYGLAGGSNEQHREVTPEFRAEDARDPRDPAYRRALRAGITSSYLAPGTLNVIAGLGAVVKTAGTDRLVKIDSALQAALGGDPCSGNRSPRSGAPENFYYRRPTNRMGVTSIVRRALFEAGKEKATSQSPLVAALRGELPVRMTARHASDVKNALKLAGDFGYPLVIDDAVEAYVLAEEIAAAGVPVILRVVADPHAGDRLAEGGKVALDAAARLHAAGVDVALGTWTDPGQAGPRDAASLAHRFGLPRDAALEAITVDAARILGVGDRIGSLEPGKDADLVAFDGDPLQVTSRVVFVMVDGHVERTSTLEEPES